MRIILRLQYIAVYPEIYYIYAEIKKHMNNFLFAWIIPATFTLLLLALILNILLGAWVRIQDKQEPPRNTLDQQMKAYLDARRKAGLPAWEDEPEQIAERPAFVRIPFDGDKEEDDSDAIVVDWDVVKPVKS